MRNDELKAIAERYEKRKSIFSGRYSRFNFSVNAAIQERQAVFIDILTRRGIESIDDLKILEVGCGTGSNLLEFLIFGARAENLVGNELLLERVTEARSRLPQATKVIAGDASELCLPNESFDIIYQSTVFSSILDDSLQVALAQRMWALLKPGGGILWYDFAFDNPKNNDVRGVKVNRIRELFPNGNYTIRKITLAPPVARLVVRWHPSLYWVCNIFPFLRTHIFCFIQKS